MAGAASASCQQADKDIKIESGRGSAKNSEQFRGEEVIFSSLLVNAVRMFSGYAGYPVNFTQGCAKHKPVLAIQLA